MTPIYKAFWHSVDTIATISYKTVKISWLTQICPFYCVCKHIYMNGFTCVCSTFSRKTGWVMNRQCNCQFRIAPKCSILILKVRREVFQHQKPQAHDESFWTKLYEIALYFYFYACIKISHSKLYSIFKGSIKSLMQLIPQTRSIS